MNQTNATRRTGSSSEPGTPRSRATDGRAGSCSRWELWPRPAMWRAFYCETSGTFLCPWLFRLLRSPKVALNWYFGRYSRCPRSLTVAFAAVCGSLWWYAGDTLLFRREP
jgi:hypothetical protein